MAENKISIQKYAMQFGTMLGLFWIGKFVFLPLGMKYQFFILVFMILTLAVPFLSYRYTCMFRDKVLGGSINFAQAWAFSVFMYIFAGLLTAVAHYIYFQFMDHGFILESTLNYLEEIRKNISLEESIDLANKEEFNSQLDALKENVMMSGNITPIEITLQLFYNNVITGGFLSLLTSLFAARKGKKDPTAFRAQ